ncbi:MAG: hypothetical protein Q9219_005252 [cf. Caloplaca sp. 3 TL-2023]
MSGFLQSVPYEATTDRFHSRQGFANRQAGRSNGTANPGQQRSQNSSPVTGNPNSPSNNGPASFPVDAGPTTENVLRSGGDPTPEPIKWFFVEEYAKLGVKGNMMPLAATPAMADSAEWLAHQTVEQYRLLENFIQVIQELHEGKKICNPECCPTMSAGRHTYTWLNTERQAIYVPASQYIMLVQRWIVGKIHDQTAFPTDSPFGTNASSFEASYPSPNIPSSQRPIPAGPTTLNRTLSDLSGRTWFGKAAGFPETFQNDVRTAWRQMCRIYAHLYHAHFIEPFWHIKHACNDLNSAFSFFASVGKLYGLLKDSDLEPMQPLVNIWTANGTIPPDCSNGAQTIV